MEIKAILMSLIGEKMFEFKHPEHDDHRRHAPYGQTQRLAAGWRTLPSAPSLGARAGRKKGE